MYTMNKAFNSARSCRLIYDPATGKPRGFGFCEYEDSETAMSAVRNLAGRELNGRPLRIDSACNAPSGGGPLGGMGQEGGGFRGAGPALAQQPNTVEVHSYNRFFINLTGGFDLAPRTWETSAPRECPRKHYEGRGQPPS